MSDGPARVCAHLHIFCAQGRSTCPRGIGLRLRLLGLVVRRTVRMKTPATTNSVAEVVGVVVVDNAGARAPTAERAIGRLAQICGTHRNGACAEWFDDRRTAERWRTWRRRSRCDARWTRAAARRRYSWPSPGCRGRPDQTRNNHRVAPKFPSWPSSLIENPY